MPPGEAATARRAEHDAAIGCAVALVCGVAFVVFVAMPVRAAQEVPVALEGVWPVGVLVGAFLGPVAAGLAAVTSGWALREGGARLTRRARALHCTTIVVSTALLVAYVAGSSAFRAWWE